jgi:acyl-CoA thioesterase I
MVLGLPTLMVGPAPVVDAEQNRSIERLSVAFCEICASRGVPFVAVTNALMGSDAWGEEVARGDGAHPSSAGYTALAQLVLTAGWLDWLAGHCELLGA